MARDLAALASGTKRRPTPVKPPPIPAAVAKQLYRVHEATEALGLSRSTVYEQLRSRRLRSVKFGRACLIPADAISEFIDLLRREAEDAT